MWKKFIFLPIANINLTFLMAWPEMKKESLLLDCCGFANIRATDFNIINNWFRKVIEFGKINVLSTFGLRRSFVELISNEFLHPQNHFVTMPDFSKKISGSLCSLLSSSIQKQPFSDVLRKMYSEYMQQMYRRTPMLKCGFNKVALHKLHTGMGVLL